MSNNIEVLVIGSNPNITFYGWRLFETRSCNLTMINEEVDINYPITFESNIFGNCQFTPTTLLNSIDQLASYTSGLKYDVVILSCTSLQDFQTLSNQLYPFLNSESIIIIESTGYINLEPFLKLNFNESWSDLVIGSIMNEFDIKKLPVKNTFVHNLKNNDNRIYLGTSIEYSFNLNQHENFKKIHKLLQLVAEDSQNKLSLLKSVLPTEFLTYQWKLALSRIIFNPLLIIFEIDYPENLSSQILCKPLISGILNELLKIIKRMDCKLVKGYENETNLINYWSSMYPSTGKNNSIKYVDSPHLFYNFYHQFNLEIDLLLLQPILLGDDNGVRTPYLENLYSMICQLNKINDPNEQSIFFERKLSSKADNTNFNNKLKDLEHLNQDYEQKMAQLNQLSNELNNIEMKNSSMANSLKEKEMLIKQISNDISTKQSLLTTLDRSLSEQQSRFNEDQLTYQNLLKDIEGLNLSKKEKMQQAKDMSMNQSNNSFGFNNVHQEPSQINNNVNQSQNQSSMSQHEFKESPAKTFNRTNNKSPIRDSIMTTDNLADLTDIAVYGAQLDGEISGLSTPRQVSSQSHNSNYNAVNNGLENQDKSQGQQFQGQQFQGQQVRNFSSSTVENQTFQGNEQIHNEQTTNDRKGSIPGQFNLASVYNQSPQSMNAQMQGNGMNGNGVNGNAMNGNAMNGNGMNGNGMNGNMHQMPMNQMSMNQMPMNQMNMNQMPVNQMPGNQMPMNQMNRYSTAGNPRSRLNSLQSTNFYDNMSMNPMQMQMMNNQMMNPMQMQMMNNQMMNPMQMQMMNGQGQMQQMPYQQRPRNPNRRSGFPSMQDNLSGIDMGGRGGMPMPSGQKGSRKSTGGIPLANGTYNRNDYESPIKHHKSSSMGNVLEGHLKIDQNYQSQQSNHLKPPQSNENSSGSSKSSDAPITVTLNDVTINVPEVQSKPLGGISNSNKSDSSKKKKKKGLFR